MPPQGTWSCTAARASSRLSSENILATVVVRGVSIRPGTTVLARTPCTYWCATCA